MIRQVQMAALFVLGPMVLAGCRAPLSGVSKTSADHHQVKSSHPGWRRTPGFASSLNPSVDFTWILPSHLPASALASHPWPLYGESPLNTLPAAWHGQDPFNHWQLPPGWAPYLLKNEAIVHPSPQNPVPVPLTLYITLQGTVFLYPQTYSGTMWLGANGYIADIPPSTILAEFVPLKPAVLAGVIPVSGGQPSGINGYTAPIWEHVLQMSATEIEHALQ